MHTNSLDTFRRAVCAGVAIVMTTLVALSFTASTARIQWLGSDAVLSGQTLGSPERA